MKVLIAVMFMFMSTVSANAFIKFGGNKSYVNKMLAEVGTKPIAGRRWCGKYIQRHVPGKWSALAIANRKHGRSCKCGRGSVIIFPHSHVGVVTGKCSATACPVVSGNGRNGRVDHQSRSLRGAVCRCP